MELKDLSVLITGGGSGLGAATARAMAAKGAKVAVFDLSGENADNVAKEIGGIAIAGDVVSEADAQGAVEKAAAAHGPARVLVNCAGTGNAIRVVGKNGPFPLDAFVRIVNINLIGTFNAMRLAAAAMSKLEPLTDGERGVIICTASVAAYEGQIGQAAYAASKGGVVGLVMPAAREFAQFGIRVNAIAPGIFSTPMLHALSEQAQQSLAASVPFPKLLGQPPQYAALVRHMIENRYLNGEVVRLDGALRMAPR